MNIYSYDQQLIEAGAVTYQPGTAWCWYRKQDGEYDTSRIDVEVVDNACKHSDSESLFQANIEAFDANTDYGRSQITLGLTRWRTNQPSRQIGLYRILPKRDYWVPVDVASAVHYGRTDKLTGVIEKANEWKRRNDSVARWLVPIVDFICPSLYIFYTDADASWRAYAQANIAEAIRCSNGKPVRPMLMPALASGTKPIPAATWEMMVEFVLAYPGVDALMLHTSDTYNSDPQWRKPLLGVLDAEPRDI